MARMWLGGLLALCGALAQTVVAADSNEPVDSPAQVASRIQGAKPEEVRATPIKGIYEYTRGTEIAYVTGDGKYAISGDLYELASDNDLTEAHRRELRAKLIAAVPETQMLIFGPKDPKYTVTVFTDVDCAYCRKLHSQIAEYNRLGITVRYLAFPRNGPGTESWTKAQQVWCSPDRKTALTRAKLGEELHVARCDDPVAREYALGRALGISGTPGIFTAGGDMLPGYMPPAEMLGELKDSG